MRTRYLFRFSVPALLLLLSVAAVAEPVKPANRVRSFLEGLDAGDAPLVAGRRLNEPELLSQLYRNREHEPLWVSGGALEQQADAVIMAISQSVSHGFSAEHYHRSTLEALQQGSDAQSIVGLELLLTDAFLSQALHRGRGVVFPPNLDADWQVPQAEVDAVDLLLGLASQHGSVLQALDALWPTDTEYARLLERRAEIASSGDEVTVQIAAGPLIKPGQTSDRILMLKERLMGPGDYTGLYDDELRREVMAFQRLAGLEPDGMVGEATLEVLNATRVSWLDRIDANLERWRWLPRETPDTYIRVNIAAFTLRAFEQGRQTLAMNVIVGQPFRRTPVFSETLKYFVLNPSWNVPYSIATKDKLPLLKDNAAAEAAKGFEAKAQGSENFVSVDAIDWSAVTPRTFNYQLRQRPGKLNALGRAKFMMPNPYAVYLHDTPSRDLFARQERTFSSGCIRLERPLELARWLLALDQNPEADELEAWVDSGATRTVYIKNPVPTYLVYFTAFANDNGDVVFRRDVYGRDAVLIEALRAQQ